MLVREIQFPHEQGGFSTRREGSPEVLAARQNILFESYAEKTQGVGHCLHR